MDARLPSLEFEHSWFLRFLADVIAPPSSLVALLGQEQATIPDVLLARTERFPDDTFLIWGTERWSNAEALAEIGRVAGLLERLGAGSRSRVVSVLTNQPAAIWSWLGTLWLGSEYVPLNHHHRGAILEDMLSRSRARILVTESSALPWLPALRETAVETVILVDPTGAEVESVVAFNSPAEVREQPAPVRPGDTACVLYTSGTTGRSKAVLVSHNQVVRGAARLVDAFGLRADDVFHNWLPLHHLGGQLHMTTTALIAGGAVALFPTFSRRRFWSEVAQARATVFCGFSAILQMLMSQPENELEKNNTLRVGIIAGIPAPIHDAFEKRFGLVIGENYGGTEADPLTAAGVAAPPPRGSFGNAAADFELAVVDEHDNPVAPGNIGEVVARPRVADVMFSGYEDDPRATLDAWRNLWFHTGDLATQDEDGFFYYKGRLAHAIRRRGENISTFELEQIVRSHPGVNDCAAVGVPSVLGEEEVKLVVSLNPRTYLEPEQLRDFCAERMAKFMVPRYIEIIDTLPYTPLGKLDRKALNTVSPETWDGGEIR